jgi:hypothetical protein
MVAWFKVAKIFTTMPTGRFQLLYSEKFLIYIEFSGCAMNTEQLLAL